MDLIFIRHARSVQNKEIGPSNWEIFKEGELDINKLATEEEIKKIDVLYCSGELKAQLTAQGLVKALQKEKIIELHVDKRLNEVNRDQGVFFESEETFRQAVKKGFQAKDQPVYSWEPATLALDRFKQFIDDIHRNDELNTKIVGIVSHGTIMSLYFGLLGNYLHDPELLFKKWSKTSFCGWGKIVDGTIRQELT